VFLCRIVFMFRYISVQLFVSIILSYWQSQNLRIMSYWCLSLIGALVSIARHLCFLFVLFFVFSDGGTPGLELDCTQSSLFILVCCLFIGV